MTSIQEALRQHHPARGAAYRVAFLLVLVAIEAFPALVTISLSAVADAFDAGRPVLGIAAGVLFPVTALVYPWFPGADPLLLPVWIAMVVAVGLTLAEWHPAGARLSRRIAPSGSPGRRTLTATMWLAVVLLTADAAAANVRADEIVFAVLNVVFFPFTALTYAFLPWLFVVDERAREIATTPGLLPSHWVGLAIWIVMTLAIYLYLARED